MRVDLGIVIAVLIGVAVWLFMRWRSLRPDFPPLNTSPDDPLMREHWPKQELALASSWSLVKGPRNVG